MSQGRRGGRSRGNLTIPTHLSIPVAESDEETDEESSLPLPVQTVQPIGQLARPPRGRGWGQNVQALVTEAEIIAGPSRISPMVVNLVAENTIAAELRGGDVLAEIPITEPSQAESVNAGRGIGRGLRRFGRGTFHGVWNVDLVQSLEELEEPPIEKSDASNSEIDLALKQSEEPESDKTGKGRGRGGGRPTDRPIGWGDFRSVSPPPLGEDEAEIGNAPAVLQPAAILRNEDANPDVEVVLEPPVALDVGNIPADPVAEIPAVAHAEPTPQAALAEVAPLILESTTTSAPVSTTTAVGPSTSAEAVRRLQREKVCQTRRGEKGARVNLQTNFLTISIDPTMKMFEYLVTFSPEIDSLSARKKLVYEVTLKESNEPKSFDGRKLILLYKADFDDKIIEANNPVKVGQTVRLFLKFVKETELEHVAQFYNVLLRRAMQQSGLKEVNRSFYVPTDVGNLKAHNLEVWSGYETAVDSYEGGLMVCIETTHRVLSTTTVLQSLQRFQQSNQPDWKEKFRASIVGSTVITRYNNMFYKIADIDWNTSPLGTFQTRGESMTFIKYYATKHGKQLTDMKQPMLTSRRKAKKNDPKAEAEVILLVPELTYATGLNPEITSNFTIMRDLIAQTRISPLQRQKNIRKLIARIADSPAASELLSRWGLTIDNTLVRVDGRVMQPPSITFNSRCTKQAPAESDFARQVTSGAVYKPIHLGRWLIFAPKNETDKVSKMIEAYRQIAPQLGITFKSPEIVPIQGRNISASDYGKALQEKAQQGEIQFVVIIMSQPRDEIYSAAKKQLVVKTAVPSQVILSKTLSNEKRLRSIMQKVVLQINCKLGGSLWALNIPLKDRIMLIGIDSYHDPKRKLRSVYAMVCGLNNTCTEFSSHCAFQSPHQETGDITGKLFLLGLEDYMKHNNGCAPGRIIIFRDGVGDGQMAMVEEQEVTAMRRIIAEICPEKVREMKFCFVVVQKRINERLFKTRTSGVVENPEPGTVVDHIITRRGVYDFFLISQLVRQGTVGPTHYVVLYDSNENKPDLVQKIAFSLTYMYFNWPGTVRVPALCQYAHKLAYLAGQHLLAVPHKDTQFKLFYL